MGLLEKIRRKLYNKKEPTPVKKGWVECTRCKYKGTFEEFLNYDKHDTRCPKCKETIQRFEL